MNRRMIKVVSLILMVALLTVSLVAGCSEEEEEAGYTITKTATALDNAGNGVIDNAGEIVEYTVEVENTSEATITGVSVSDSLSISLTRQADNPGNDDDDLDEGETWVYTGSYTVQQSDLDAGSIENTSTVSSNELADKSATEEVSCGKTVIKFALDIPLSGAAATAYIPTKLQTEAFIRYINAEDPIPGVELEVITYDNQYDPAESIPSYLDLVDRGAKFIAWADSTCATNILEITDEDEFLVVAGNGTAAILEDPGHTFCATMPFSYCTEGFMRWLEDAWLDYPTKPKVGCFGWNMSFGIDHAAGAEEYAEAHPDKFDWVGTELAPYGTASWATEVEKLKDCDYIVIGAFAGGAASFINEFSGKGYDTIFVHSDPVMGFWESVTEPSCDPEALDGNIWACMARYYRADPGEIGNIILDKLIPTYSTAEEAESFVTAPYSCVANLAISAFVVEVIREAVSELADPADLTSQMMYDTIFSPDFDFDLEGYPEMSYTEELPVLMRWARIYEYSATLGDFEKLSDWIQW